MFPKGVTFSISNYVKQSRKAKGLSQKELGIELGVSGQVLSNFERGVAPFPLERLHKLIEILDMDKDLVCKLLLRAAEIKYRQLLTARKKWRR